MTMAEISSQISLPTSVTQMIDKICSQQSLEVDLLAKRVLVSLDEQLALDILKTADRDPSRTPVRNLSAYIIHMAKQQQGFALSPEVLRGSPPKRTLPCSPTTEIQSSISSYFSPIRRQLSFASPSSGLEQTDKIKELLLILSDLEFRKLFLVLSYLGKKGIDEAMHVSDAKKIVELNCQSMTNFEHNIWITYGTHYCPPSDRIKYADSDSGKTHLYYCHVDTDGSYVFKGPFLDTTRTHLQRALGDENVLIVKFADEKVTNLANSVYHNIAEQGILLGLRRFRFFVFKDGGKAEKKKGSSSSAVKCYFVRMESTDPRDVNYTLSNKTVPEARSLFMHLHTVPSMAKYAARSLLILSKTIKLQINLDSVHVKRINDILCYDENGDVVYEDGEPLIQTDGTGFISEDLAMICPAEFHNAKHIRYEYLEFLEDTSTEQRGKKDCIREPPLLIQCRLFKDGLAVKGTLLLNKKLPERTIEIRPSMIKVENDPLVQNTRPFNSLEAVAVSAKPRKATLSKNLIALLSYGGVRQDFFLSLLEESLEEVQNVHTSKRLALRVAINHGEIDDNYITMRMILAGIPLNEPYLRHRLFQLTNEEKKNFKIGRLPISESFYLMGTVDPTGLLTRDQVCVILENGQISGKVLVYRNPGLHFGDIHVLNATYIPELHEYVGNAKYAIFFSTKGPRSVGSEIANGDFDGDMYWVSRNPQLLEEFKPSEPWTRSFTTPKPKNVAKPSEFTHEKLEYEYFQLFLNARNQSNCMGVAADSWQALMDRLLILSDKCCDEKERMKKSMLQLIDTYYDALDSSKSGKEVKFPEELRVEMMPHYMEREKKYYSTSVLGQMYDKIHNSRAGTSSLQEIWKLPCFDDANAIPQESMCWGEDAYRRYTNDMKVALNSDDDAKNYLADVVIKKYKQELYAASEFEESAKEAEKIYNDALALYHAAYNCAYKKGDAKRCGFVWKVAGHALCKLYAFRQNGNSSVVCLPSVLKEVFNLTLYSCQKKKLDSVHI